MKIVIFGNVPKEFGFNLASDERKPYSIYIKKGINYIWYTKKFPRIDDIHKSLVDGKKRKVIFFDRIKGWKTPVSIRDHVNISGINGLIGKTPFKHFPMFPDMTNIYKTTTAYPPKKVFTVGRERFNGAKISKKLISENAGHLTPIFKYFGLETTAFGIPENMKNKKSIVESCIQQATTC